MRTIAKKLSEDLGKKSPSTSFCLDLDSIGALRKSVVGISDCIALTTHTSSNLSENKTKLYNTKVLIYEC